MGTLTRQPTLLKTVADLQRFTELAKTHTTAMLAAEFNMSQESVYRYKNCLREGQKLRMPASYDTEKLTAEELVAKHRGKIQYRAWA